MLDIDLENYWYNLITLHDYTTITNTYIETCISNFSGNDRVYDKIHSFITFVYLPISLKIWNCSYDV